MAENKKSFILYVDQKEIFDQLPNEIAGKLIKHIFSYVADDNPVSDDNLLLMAFTPIKTQLKRDLRKFESIKQARSEAGKKGMQKRWSNDNKNNNVKQNITNITVNDNVSDSVTSKKINNKKTTPHWNENLDVNGHIKK